MLKVPSADVPALTAEVRLPQEQVLDTLRELEDRGLVSRATGHEARFIAAAPDLADAAPGAPRGAGLTKPPYAEPVNYPELELLARGVGVKLVVVDAGLAMLPLASGGGRSRA